MAFIDLQFNYPILPDQRQELSSYVEKAMAESSKWMELPPYGGYLEHREAASKWLSRRGESVECSRVMLAAGGHNGVMASMLVAELGGKRIATDPMTYPGFKMQAAWLGSSLIPCESDHRGMRPDALARAAVEEGAAAVYLMPTVHNPWGTVIPVERRRELCEVAARHRMIILDDDAYGFCEAEPPANFATLAPDRSYFIHSFTKPYAPAMKLAYVVFPEGKESQMAQALRALSSGASVLLAEAAAKMIAAGDIERLLERKRDEAVMRQKIASKAFAGLNTTAHPTSFHVWIELNESQSADEIAKGLENDGILVSSSSGYAAREDVKSNGLRVALGAVRDLGKLESAMARVRKEIDEAGRKAM